MFEMVVGSLGKVALLRGEDAGDIFYATDAELAVPDFRVALHDTSQLLIEVKNHYQKKPHEPHVEKTEYLEKLTAYAALTKCELLIATYWTRWNTWTLVPVDAFSREGSRSVLTMENAIMASQMARVGDVFIGTRSPLRFRVDLVERNRSTKAGKDNRLFTIDQVRLFSEDRQLTDPVDRRIATALLFYGAWEEEQCVEENASGHVTAVEYRFSPPADGQRQEVQGFDFVDRMSSLLSRKFQQGTSSGGKVTGIRLDFEPGNFGRLIPEDFKSEALPLWRMTQQP
jgi:Holliday junction resolvase